MLSATRRLGSRWLRVDTTQLRQRVAASFPGRSEVVGTGVTLETPDDVPTVAATAASVAAATAHPPPTSPAEESTPSLFGSKLTTGGSAMRAITERLLGDTLSASADTARIPVNVAGYLVAREYLLQKSNDAARGKEVPAEAMSLKELVHLRDILLGSTASYLLARSGAFALDAYLAACMPEFRADLRLSDDDHLALVSDSRREVLFSCRGTDRMSKERERRDVLAYWAIIRCRTIDPKDHPRLTKTLRQARDTYERYHVREGYSFKCVGHSFGGFAATVCAQELDCHAVNFNGPVYRPLDGISLGTFSGQDRAVDAAVDAAVHSVCDDPADASSATKGPAPVPAASTPTKDATKPGANDSSAPPPQQGRVVTRRGHVHHVQTGNDVVSLVGGALPHDCERYTRLEHVGGPWDVAGAHLRYSILTALDRDILAAAGREGLDPLTVHLRPCPDCIPHQRRKGYVPAAAGPPLRRVADRCPWVTHEDEPLLIAP